jgi:hypothetical protein
MAPGAPGGNYLSAFALLPAAAMARIGCANMGSGRAGGPAKVRHFRGRFIALFKLSGYELLSISKRYP